MSASALPMHPLPKIIERYRDSWLKHDIVALTDLFAANFTYTLNGINRFPNKKALRNYWCRNAFRQRGLELKFHNYRRTRAGHASLFTATFYHPARMSFTNVSGDIEIRTDRSGKTITHVIERYEKTEIFAPLYALESLPRFFLYPAIRWFKRKARPLLGLIKAIGRNVLTLAFILGVLAVAYVGWLHNIRQILSAELVEDIKSALPYWFAASYLLQQALPFFKKSATPDVVVETFEGTEDLHKMTAQIKGADFVQIISGDFSFLDLDGDLEDCLRALAFEKKLELFSYKSKDVVEQELNSKTRSREILLKLLDENRFHFDCPVEAKVTLVERGGQRRMLFRFAKDEGDGAEFHMGTIRHTHNTAYLLTVIDRMMMALRPRPPGISGAPSTAPS